MSGSSQFSLLKQRRFLPFFIVQALGAFNDNVYRQAIIALLFYMGVNPEERTLYTNLAPALFILPYFLFSATAGQIAEKLEKSRLIRITTTMEIVIMSLAAIGFITQNMTLLLIALFGTGLQSTLFGPVKYSILPSVLKPEELTGGNGLVEMGTSISILTGMIFGGMIFVIAGSHGPVAAATAIITLAVLGNLVSRSIPRIDAGDPSLRINWNPIPETLAILRLTRKQLAVRNAILGVSWFWFIGTVLTAQLPTYAEINLGSGLNHMEFSGPRQTVKSGHLYLGSTELEILGGDLRFSEDSLEPSSKPHLLRAKSDQLRIDAGDLRFAPNDPTVPSTGLEIQSGYLELESGHVELAPSHLAMVGQDETSSSAKVTGSLHLRSGGSALYIFALALFSIGTGIGSLLCEKLSGRTVEIGLVPLGSFGISCFMLDLYFANPGEALANGLTVSNFLQQPGSWRTVMDLTGIGLFAGFFIVPLFALIQSRTPKQEISRVIAGLNIQNSLFIVAAAVIGIVVQRFLGWTIPQVFLALAIVNLTIAIYIFSIVPEFLMRFVSWLMVRTLYRLRVHGIERIPDEGPVLIVCNHVSYMDALILSASIPRPVHFVMYYKIFNIPVMSWIFRTAKAIPIASVKEDPDLMHRAFDEVDHALEEGEIVGIFPEGALTRDGEIAPFKAGVERIAERHPVTVVPIALKGMWASMWSRKEGGMRLPRRFRAHVDVIVGEAIPAGEPVQAQKLEAQVRAIRGNDA
jgi:1-acyl-sn-glycerol-3-phosphate acyltransferase